MIFVGERGGRRRSDLLWSERAGWGDVETLLSRSAGHLSLSLSAGGFTLGQPTNQLLLGPADQWQDSAVAGQPMRGQCWMWPVRSSRSEVSAVSLLVVAVWHRPTVEISVVLWSPSSQHNHEIEAGGPSSCLGWVPCLWWGQTKSLYWENILTNCRSTGQPSRN